MFQFANPVISNEMGQSNIVWVDTPSPIKLSDIVPEVFKSLSVIKRDNLNPIFSFS